MDWIQLIGAFGVGGATIEFNDIRFEVHEIEKRLGRDDGFFDVDISLIPIAANKSSDD